MKNFLITSAFLFVLWQLLYFGVGNDIIIPQLDSILSVVPVTIMSENFLFAIGNTLGFLIEAWLITVVVVVLLITLSLASATIKDVIRTMCGILLTVPSFVWLPIFIMVIGLNREAILTLTVLSSVTLAGHTCITAVEFQEKKWGKHVENLRMPLIQSVYQVYLPSIQEVLTSSLLSAWNLAWRIIVAIEVVYGAIGKHWGVGTYMIHAKDAMERDEMYAILLLIICISVLFHKIILMALKKFSN